MSRAPRSSRNLTEYWSPYYNPSSFFFDPVSPAEIEREILLIPQNKTYRFYSCPIRILTDVRCVISGLRSIIMTKSVQKGVFPAKLKKAKVVPVYQNDDKPEPGNCRSISLLSIFNRIFEKLKYHRLKSFRGKNDILFKSHYGFRGKNIPRNMPLLTVLASVNVIQIQYGPKIFHLRHPFRLKKGL